MNRRGFALVAVLWALTALTVLTGAALSVARMGWQTTRNRIYLTRSGWAREACVEILLARYAQARSVRKVDTVDLGRGTWCVAKLEDPAAKMNVNVAEREAIERLISAISHQPSAVDSIVAIRRRGPIYDLEQVTGVDSVLAVRLAPFLTTRGAGAINVNAAPREVLATLPGMTEEAISVLVRRRANRRPLGSADELAAALSPSARALLLADYAEFVRHAVFAPQQLVAIVDGGVHGTALSARAILTVVPAPGRLAIIRRETE